MEASISHIPSKSRCLARIKTTWRANMHMRSAFVLILSDNFAVRFDGNLCRLNVQLPITDGVLDLTPIFRLQNWRDHFHAIEFLAIHA